MKRPIHILIFAFLFVCLGQEVYGQYNVNQGYWKKYRSQVTAAIGTSNFLGELGGRDRVGSDFYWDLETRVFKPAFTLGYRYYVARNMAVYGNVSYAVLAGDDALTREPFRYNRNLHFRSRIWEFNASFEYMLYRIIPGHRYKLEGVDGQKPRIRNLVFFAGLGGMTFNPQGKVGDSWYDLRPLGTEGQNFEDGPEPYSLFSMVVPFGIAYRWKPDNEHFFVGISFGHRFTFTDYLDDVSTVYYENSALGDQSGLSEQENILAQYFGDPARGYYLDENGDQVELNSTFTGAQRGDSSDRDGYMFAQITVSYAFQKQPYSRAFSKARRGKRITF